MILINSKYHDYLSLSRRPVAVLARGSPVGVTSIIWKQLSSRTSILRIRAMVGWTLCWRLPRCSFLWFRLLSPSSMADANARMVEANSWPFVAFSTHNVDEHGNANVRLVLNNQGIGPARIQTFELWYKGQPMASTAALIKACCETNPTEMAQAGKTTWSVGLTAPSILRAGDHSDFLTAAYSNDNKDLWKKFNVERDKINVRICYCSVFDECWVGSGQTTDAQRVPGCPAPAVPFRLN